MPTKMFFEADNCRGVSTGNRHYGADRQGFIQVNDAADVKTLKEGGYIVAGGMPRLSTYWVCDKCSWEASINSCGKCGSKKLRRVTK